MYYTQSQNLCFFASSLRAFLRSTACQKRGSLDVFRLSHSFARPVAPSQVIRKMDLLESEVGQLPCLLEKGVPTFQLGRGLN